MAVTSAQPGQVTERIVLLVRECAHLPEEQALAPDTALADAGVDSMALVELLVRVEEDLGVLIPDELLTPETFESAASIADAVTRLLREETP